MMMVTQSPETCTERTKCTKKNCTPSWLYLQDYTRMHGQQNIKKCTILFVESGVTQRYTDWYLIFSEGIIHIYLPAVAYFLPRKEVRLRK